MAGAIIGLLTALPQILTIVQSLGSSLSKLLTWLEAASGNDREGFIVKVGSAFDQLSNAKTEQERRDASKSIADLLHSLPH